ncbi:YhgE/Pip domain-containing protein [Paenibacillus monticola]|nr:ABC transporter permease [Paenibacillus monticola]
MNSKLLFQFLKQPVTIVGIITAILFQVFFSLIWITGYDHVTDRVTQLPIAIVNEDGAAAQPIADGISESLKFEIKKNLTLAEAKDALESREIRLIINIPQGFTGQISDPSGHAEIRYFLNESNPQMVSNVMQTVALKVTAALNTESSSSSLNQTLIGMKLPEAQAKIIRNSTGDRVTSDVQIINPATNFAQTMVPLMIVTASFTGSMLLAMNLNRASSNLSLQAGKWQRLSARFILLGATAFITSLIGTSMIHWLGIPSSLGFMAMWMFEFIVIISCMSIAQLSLILLGDAGAWLNIALLSIQMLSSGATIPRDLLSPFYSWIGQFFPAYYAVNGMLDLVIGGSGVGQNVLALIAIGAVAVALSIFLTFIRREPKITKEPEKTLIHDLSN